MDHCESSLLYLTVYLLHNSRDVTYNMYGTLPPFICEVNRVPGVAWPTRHYLWRAKHCDALFLHLIVYPMSNSPLDVIYNVWNMVNFHFCTLQCSCCITHVTLSITCGTLLLFICDPNCVQGFAWPTRWNILLHHFRSLPDCVLWRIVTVDLCT